MKRAGFAVLLLSLASAMAAVPASADTLYSNPGPYTYLVGGYFINQGQGIGDSFTLSRNATVTGVDFVESVLAGDMPTTVDWSISADPFSGYLAASPAAALSGSYLGSAFGGYYDVYSESFSVTGLSLSAGTYWLELQNAVTAASDSAYWDISGGPSQVGYSEGGIYEGSLSSSNAFDVRGIPEPSTFLLLLTGMVGLALMLKRGPWPEFRAD